jgi:LysM repeat protein
MTKRKLSASLLGLCLGLGCWLLSDGSAQAADRAVHLVVPGESLWTIARRYNVTVDALRTQNGLGETQVLREGQKLAIPSSRGSRAKTSAASTTANSDAATAAAGETRAANWVIQKPTRDTQVQKSAAERGINPCNTPDRGFGIYDRWSRAPALGQMIAPHKGGISADGRFDVMFHFHGHEPARKEWVQVMDGAVLVGIDLGIGSGAYANAFQAPDMFKRLVESVEGAMSKKTERPGLRVRHVGLSGWSAGYGAIQEIVNQSYGRRIVDAVILLDGLHSGYAGDSLNLLQLRPFIEYARQAAARDKLMFVSHSSIIPPGYASTTETANLLIAQLGGRPRRVAPRRGDPMGLDLVSRYTQGNFHVRGYAGNDTLDHCAHLGLYRDILQVHVKPRWRSPRGRRK